MFIISTNRCTPTQNKFLRHDIWHVNVQCEHQSWRHSEVKYLRGRVRLEIDCVKTKHLCGFIIQTQTEHRTTTKQKRNVPETQSSLKRYGTLKRNPQYIKDAPWLDKKPLFSLNRSFHQRCTWSFSQLRMNKACGNVYSRIVLRLHTTVPTETLPGFISFRLHTTPTSPAAARASDFKYFNSLKKKPPQDWEKLFNSAPPGCHLVEWGSVEKKGPKGF